MDYLDVIKYFCLTIFAVGLLKYLSTIIVAVLNFKSRQTEHKDSLKVISRNGVSLSIETTSLKFQDIHKIKAELESLDHKKAS